jgi:hypothetical protein
MKNLLLEIKGVVEETKPIASLAPAQLKSPEERYEQIIEKGLAENFPSPRISLSDGAERNKARRKIYWVD